MSIRRLPGKSSTPAERRPIEQAVVDFDGRGALALAAARPRGKRLEKWMPVPDLGIGRNLNGKTKLDTAKPPALTKTKAELDTAKRPRSDTAKRPACSFSMTRVRSCVQYSSMVATCDFSASASATSSSRAGG